MSGDDDEVDGDPRGRFRRRGAFGFVGRLRRRVVSESAAFLRWLRAELRAAPGRALTGMSGVVRTVALEYPAVMLGPIRALRKLPVKAVSAARTARVDAVLSARVHGWSDAADRLDAAAPTCGPGSQGLSALQPLARPVASIRKTTAPLPLARPVVRRGADLPDAMADRLVVYTALIGEDRSPPSIFVRPDGVRFVCFTDRPLDRDIEGGQWEVSLVEPVSDPVRERSRYRILPHEVLEVVAPECDWSIYVDPDLLVVGNLQTLVTRWLLPHEMVMFRDPTAAGWWDLAERHVILGEVGAALVGGFAELESLDVPATAGAYDTSLIWRRHMEPTVIEQMKRWWEITSRFPGLDDLSLAVGSADPATARPTSLPLSLGAADDSWFSAAVPAPAAPTLRRTTAPGRRRTTVAFLRDPVANQEITTVLRGEQLSRLVAERYSDEYDVVYTDDRHSLSDHVVIVLKQALQHLAPDELEELSRRNIAVVNCWDDHPPDRDRLLAADAQMVLAIGQLIDLRRRLPERPTFMVTHHVNLDFPSGDPPQDRLRTGYFGAPYNTVLPPTLNDLIDVVHTAVLVADDSHWMQRLLDHNCHWAIRKRQYWDGWKPFMKGFVAARYGAPVIVGVDDDDAKYYLGDDYPFYATGTSDAELELLLLRVDAAFGGPEWELARGIMRQVAERSSDAQVCADFHRMVDHLAS
jgi:hypothetical protein